MASNQNNFSVNITEGLEEIKKIVSTISTIMNGTNLQDYLLDSEKLVEKLTNAYKAFNANAEDTKAAEELVKVSNALTAIQYDFSGLRKQYGEVFDGIIEKARSAANTVNELFSIRKFEDAFVSKSYFPNDTVFSNLTKRLAIADSDSLRQIDALNAQVSMLKTQLSQSRSNAADLKREVDSLSDASGVTEYKEKVEDLERELTNIKDRAKEEIRTFIRANDLDPDYVKIERYYDMIEERSMSAKQAIAQLKHDYSYFFENRSGGVSSGIGDDFFEQIETVKTSISELSDKIEESGGQIANGALESVIESLKGVSESSGGGNNYLISLLTAVKESALAGENNLNGLRHTISSLSKLSEVTIKKSNVDNVNSLLREIDGLKNAQNFPLVSGLNLQGVSNIKISKTIEHLSNALPIISEKVNVANLKALESIDLSKFTLPNITQASADAFIKILDGINQQFSGQGSVFTDLLNSLAAVNTALTNINTQMTNLSNIPVGGGGNGGGGNRRNGGGNGGNGGGNGGNGGGNNNNGDTYRQLRTDLTMALRVARDLNNYLESGEIVREANGLYRVADGAKMATPYLFELVDKANEYGVAQKDLEDRIKAAKLEQEEEIALLDRLKIGYLGITLASEKYGEKVAARKNDAADKETAAQVIEAQNDLYSTLNERISDAIKRERELNRLISEGRIVKDPKNGTMSLAPDEQDDSGYLKRLIGQYSQVGMSLDELRDITNKANIADEHRESLLKRLSDETTEYERRQDSLSQKKQADAEKDAQKDSNDLYRSLKADIEDVIELERDRQRLIEEGRAIEDEYTGEMRVANGEKDEVGYVRQVVDLYNNEAESLDEIRRRIQSVSITDEQRAELLKRLEDAHYQDVKQHDAEVQRARAKEQAEADKKIAKERAEAVKERIKEQEKAEKDLIKEQERAEKDRIDAEKKADADYAETKRKARHLEYQSYKDEITQILNLEREISRKKDSGGIYEFFDEAFTKDEYSEALLKQRKKYSSSYAELRDSIEKADLEEEQRISLLQMVEDAEASLTLSIKKRQDAEKSADAKRLATKAKSDLKKSEAEAESQKYKDITAQIDQYYKYLGLIEKYSQKSTDLTYDGATDRYTLGGDPEKNEMYRESLALLDKSRDALKALGVDFEHEIDIENMTTEQRKKNAEALGISLKDYEDLARKVNKAVAENAVRSAKEKEDAENRWQNIASKINEQITKRDYAIIKKDPTARALADDIISIIKSNDPERLDELTDKFNEYRAAVRATGADIETSWQRLKKSLGGSLRMTISGFIIGNITKYLRSIYNDVLNVDSALTQLKIVTGETRAVMENFAETAEKSAQRVGASVTDILSSTETFARLGYSLKESGVFAELATAYSKIANTDINSATTAITSIVKAFDVNADQLESVLDKLVWTGQEYPISAAEIGEGMQNAGSMLKSAGNTMEESIALLTAANTTIQDVGKASTALRTIAARMRASTVDLEALGESTDDVLSTAKLEKFMKAFGISLTDAKGELRSTMAVLTDLSKIWDTLGTTQRSSIAEKFAGNKQQNIFFSLMDSFDSALEVMDKIDESSGLLASATNERMNSIQGKIDELGAKLQTLSNDILDSGLVKFLLDIVSGIVSAVNGVVKLTNAVGGLKMVLYVVASVYAVKNLSKLPTFIASIAKFLKPIMEFVRLPFDKAIAFITTFFADIGNGGTTLSHFRAGLDAISGAALTAEEALGGVLTVVGLVIALFEHLNAVNQNRIRELQVLSSESSNSVEQYTDEIKTLDELIKKYRQLSKEKGNGAWDSDVHEEVRGIQEEITKLVGEQANNLDLVNGKLEDQLEIYKQISDETKTETENQIKIALNTAEQAIKREMRSIDLSDLVSPKYTFLNPASIVSAISDYGIALKQSSSIISPILTTGAAFETNFLKVDQFIEQYENIRAMVEDMSINGVGTGYGGIYNAGVDFISDYKDLYDTYINAKSAAEAYEAVINNVANAENRMSAHTFELKTALEILEKVQDGYDGIVNALKDMDTYGYLTTGTLKSLLDLEKDHKLAGLELEEILTRLTDETSELEVGYYLVDGALEKYVSHILNAVVESAKLAQTEEAINNAIETLKNYYAVFNTLALTYEQEVSNSRKKDFENQKDELKKQLDDYKKLIDIRKQLLKTYQDETKYQKELSEKQRDLTKLQQQLAASRFDNSAAGRARQRQLTEDVTKAQDSLDELTLDHAIEMATQNLDNQYEEFEILINGKIDEIEKKLDEINGTNSGISAEVKEEIATAARNVADTINGAIKDLKDKIPVEVEVTVPESGENQTIPGSMVVHSGAVEVYTSGVSIDPAKYNPPASGDSYLEYLDDLSKGKLKLPHSPKYHSGGLVGDLASLKSNEEFAKLMKGEFVSTPAMMENFMKTVLPSLVAYAGSSGGGTQEFNAPLVSLQCDSITEESLPKVRDIVNEAVSEVKKLFTSGMSRSGFLPQPKKLPI